MALLPCSLNRKTEDMCVCVCDCTRVDFHSFSLLVLKWRASVLDLFLWLRRPLSFDADVDTLKVKIKSEWKNGKSVSFEWICPVMPDRTNSTHSLCAFSSFTARVKWPMSPLGLLTSKILDRWRRWIRSGSSVCVFYCCMSLTWLGAMSVLLDYLLVSGSTIVLL